MQPKIWLNYGKHLTLRVLHESTNQTRVHSKGRPISILKLNSSNCLTWRLSRKCFNKKIVTNLNWHFSENMGQTTKVGEGGVLVKPIRKNPSKTFSDVAFHTATFFQWRANDYTQIFHKRYSLCRFATPTWLSRSLCRGHPKRMRTCHKVYSVPKTKIVKTTFPNFPLRMKCLEESKCFAWMI